MNPLHKKNIKNSGLLLSVLMLVFAGQSCVKGTPKGNTPPDTKISIDSIDLSGDERLNSSVYLSWYGTDLDGYIEYFEVSTDNNTWKKTNAQDSIILFDIPAGQDTADVFFYVRAIDNNLLTDPTPASLRVPLKNAPPRAVIKENVSPSDTAFIASTFAWEATDPDGNASISRVEVRFNNGTWHEINRGQSLLSFVVDTSVQSGSANADLYYGQENTPATTTIDGLEVNGLNYFQIRAFDIAGAESPVDTADVFYLKNKTPNTDLLWVNGHIKSVKQEYRALLDSIGARYDLLDYGPQQPSDVVPAYVNPTFKLIAKHYPKLFLASDRSIYTNAVTLKTATLTAVLAPVVQYYSNNNGKTFITTSFGLNADVSQLIGPYPIAGIETNDIGRARIYTDSSLVPLQTGYPELKSNAVQLAIVPIIASSDAQEFYRAELNNGRDPWPHSDIIAAARRPQNILTQVFFAVELHKYNRPDVIQLFDEILNDEF